jgi:LmbE family N-acetylglucosaminyl deacetylase
MAASADPYLRWLQQLAALLRAELPVPAPESDGDARGPTGRCRPDAPCCLMLSPHPDDECIVGALALRLRREAGWRVINCAVTLGSRLERRQARLAELQAACRRLDFEPVLPLPEGLEHVSLATRRDRPHAWRAKVDAITRVLHAYRPQLVMLPHADDGSATHQGVHALGRDAIAQAALPLTAAFTEYWGTLPQANLLVETSLADTAQLLRALSCHVGELSRNPYHRRLPAGMADAVRRGGELVLGAGSTPPSADFATLYLLQRFSGEQWLPPAAGRVQLAATPLTAAALGIDA